MGALDAKLPEEEGIVNGCPGAVYFRERVEEADLGAVLVAVEHHFGQG